MMVNFLLCVGWGPLPDERYLHTPALLTYSPNSSDDLELCTPWATCHSAFVPVSLQSLNGSPCPRDSQAGLCPKTSWRTGSNTGSWAPAPLFDSVVLDQGCRICVCPGDAVHLGTTLREPLSYAKLSSPLILSPGCCFCPRAPLASASLVPKWKECFRHGRPLSALWVSLWPLSFFFHRQLF